MSSKPKNPSSILEAETTEGKRKRKKKGKGLGRKRNPCLKKYKDFCIHGTCQYLRDIRAPSCVWVSEQNVRPNAVAATPQCTNRPLLWPSQVPPKLLGWKVSSLHAACAVTRGLQQDHGAGCDSRGVVVRLPHNHRAAVGAKVSSAHGTYMVTY